MKGIPPRSLERRDQGGEKISQEFGVKEAEGREPEGQQGVAPSAGAAEQSGRMGLHQVVKRLLRTLMSRATGWWG